jgi:hypothetical protein
MFAAIGYVGLLF